MPTIPSLLSICSRPPSTPRGGHGPLLLVVLAMLAAPALAACQSASASDPVEPRTPGTESVPTDDEDPAPDPNDPSDDGGPGGDDPAPDDPPDGPSDEDSPDGPSDEDPDAGDGEGVGADECSAEDAAWIWCDDFEADRLDRYFEYAELDGGFVREEGVGFEGSTGMRVRFQEGQVEAGYLHLAFGRTPQPYFRPVDAGTEDFREIYWRMYVRHAPDWIGGGGEKLSRATSFVSSTSWAQSMIAHLWSGGEEDAWLVLDPASGTDPAGSVQTTGYNDGANLRWLGIERGSTPLFHPAYVGEWYCIEAHVRLNAPGRADGVLEFWIDGSLEARRDGLNWVGSYSDYGLNALFVENYWNSGSPREQERYFDRLIVSRERIGC